MDNAQSQKSLTRFRLSTRYRTAMPSRYRFPVPITLKQFFASLPLAVVGIEDLHLRGLFAAVNVRRCHRSRRLMEKLPCAIEPTRK